MRKHKIAVALACVVFFTAASGAVGAGQARRPLPGPEFGLPIPYEGWRPCHDAFHFSPNDAYFPYNSPEGFPGQWHLQNQTPGGGPDANLAGAWGRDLTGAGVIIGIVDAGLQRLHPDLALNYVGDGVEDGPSRDFRGNDNDPSPVYANENHGTAVAGVAAARGGNVIGVSGAAPYAGLAGLRVDVYSDQNLVDATLHYSSGENTDIKIKNHSYGKSFPYVDDSNQVGALVTSAGAGTIHVFSGGNNRFYHGLYYQESGEHGGFQEDEDYAVNGDANMMQKQSVPESIAVAALAEDGTFAWYSNWGANVFVTAPSNGIGGFDITTTDRTGAYGYNSVAGGGDGDSFPNLDYTSTFGGTSSAAPLVAGIMALGKEAYPDMDVRAAKHLLAKTSAMVDAGDVDMRGGWVTNAAGYHFNNNYGFGLIDADAFTSLAELADDGDGVTTLETQTTGTIEVDEDFGGESGDPTWLSDTFVFTTAGQLEDVEVFLDITHGWRGDVEAYLTSPGGTTSRLMTRNYYDSFDNIDWTFTSNAFWGEDPVGTWELRVIDTFKDENDGTWNDYAVTANMGTLDLAAEWKLAGGDSYNDSANWTDLSVPNAVDAVANFLEKIEGNATVTVDSPVTVGSINFDNAYSYTIAGPATVTLETSGGDAEINVVEGDHTILAPLSVADALTVDTAEGSSLTLGPNVLKPGGDVNLASGTTLKASGVINSLVYGDVTTEIIAEGNLIIGDPDDGYTYEGHLKTGGYSLMLVHPEFPHKEGTTVVGGAKIPGADLQNGTLSTTHGLHLLPVDWGNMDKTMLKGDGKVHGWVVAGNPPETPAWIEPGEGNKITFMGNLQGCFAYVGDVEVLGHELPGFSPGPSYNFKRPTIAALVLNVAGSQMPYIPLEVNPGTDPIQTDLAEGYSVAFVSGGYGPNGETLLNGLITMRLDPDEVGAGNPYEFQPGDKFYLVWSGPGKLGEDEHLDPAVLKYGPGFGLDLPDLTPYGLQWNPPELTEQYVKVSIVPEPGTLLLLATGGLALLLVWRRRRRS